MKSALIICRTEAVVESLRMALGEDYLVRVSASTDDAAELIYRDQADLVVIEGEPETQGRLDEIRTLSAINPGVPVVVIATSVNSPFARRAYDAGAAEVTGKPFDRDDLLTILKKAARLRELALKAAQGTAAQPSALPRPTDENKSISAHMLLRSLQGLIAAGANSKELSEALAKSVSELLVPSSVAVFVLNPSLSHFTCRAAERYPPEIQRLLVVKRSDPLVLWLVKHGRIFSDELIAAEAPTEDAPAVQRSVSALGGKVAVPLLGGKRLIGFMLLGNKLTSSSYSVEDMELLTRLSFASSPPLEKALDFESRLPEGPGPFADIRAGVLSIDAHEYISNLNQRAADYLGVSPDEARGKRLLEVNPELSECAESCCRERKHLTVNITAPGSDKKLLVDCFPVESEGDGRAGAMLFLSETEGVEPSRVAAESELRRFWSNLSTRLAHEVKNPLVAIKTFTQLLPERYGEEAFRNQFFKVVSGEVDRLNSITEQLVRFAQPPELSLSPLDLEPVVRLAIAELEEEIRLNKANVVVDVPEVLPKVLGDASALREALTYVIDNGVDAVAENGSTSIRISANALSSRNGNTVRLTVEDSGIGIRKEQIREVFVPFFTTKIRGIGLGLSIAKRIIEEHRGEISIESEEGRGTRVHITLPAAG